MSITTRIVLPAIIAVTTAGASAIAAAAELDVSNGFITAPVPTAVGHDFAMSVSGTIAQGGVTRATDVELDCAVDVSHKNIDCEGVLTVGVASADIRMDYVNATGVARWTIESSASVALDVAHAAWGEEVVPAAMGLPYPWDVMSIFDGSNWRHFYYSTTWASTYTSITGLQYENPWEA